MRKVLLLLILFSGTQKLPAQNNDSIYCDTTIHIQKMFFPTGEDIRNDVFLPTFSCTPTEYQMQIFDYWGNLVFTTGNYRQYWDGRINGNGAQTDNYICKIKYRFENEKVMHEKTAKFSLVR